jgi:glycosyltransferase involved in cell wall biosynthesis
MQKQPLISIVIPCYNQGRYLEKAIKSVLSQTYKHHEIIVVDDGSTDHTKSVTEKFPEVIYVYQDNQGLSAARNIGIDHSKGEFLVFLDADDWLLPNALEINLSCIIQKPELAFVYGTYTRFFEDENRFEEENKPIIEDQYLYLLASNYIGMIATVLFQRWVFDEFRYDIALKTCEDYDLYLKITRLYPAGQHANMVSVYRIHGKSLSRNSLIMLENVFIVLERQKNLVRTKKEKYYYKKGLKFWKFYAGAIYSNLAFQIANNHPINKSDVIAFKKYHRHYYYRVIAQKGVHFLKGLLLDILKMNFYRMLPDFIIQRIEKSSVPKLKKVHMGDLNRMTPFSKEFGYDRGGPLDRYYIENFLEYNKLYIKGRVLEIGDNIYTIRFGGMQVKRSEILHVDEKNKEATYIGDLADAPILPDNTFDCIILTQTLHLIYEYQKALETCYRILKPGGVLLLTVPGLSRIDQDDWKDIWFWTFTQNSITKMLSKIFPQKNITIQTHGNLLVVTAFLYGMGRPELKKEQMDETDQHYPVIITATAIKQ